MKINKLEEHATTSNIYKRLTDNKTCAIISACIGESLEEDDTNMTKLKSEVRKLKLGYNQFKSRWVHAKEGLEIFEMFDPRPSMFQTEYTYQRIYYKED